MQYWNSTSSSFVAVKTCTLHAVYLHAAICVHVLDGSMETACTTYAVPKLPVAC